MAYRRTLARRQVVLNLVTGRSFVGVLLRQDGPLLVLVNAQMRENGRTVDLDGSVVVERSHVEFAQVIGEHA